MKLAKIIAAACVLALSPTFAMAMGCQGGAHQAAMSCAEGSIWDADSRRCVEDMTG